MRKTIVAVSLAISAAMLGGCAAGTSLGSSALPNTSQTLNLTRGSARLLPLDSVGGFPDAQARPKRSRHIVRPLDSVGGGLPQPGNGGP